MPTRLERARRILHIELDHSVMPMDEQGRIDVILAAHSKRSTWYQVGGIVGDGFSATWRAEIDGNVV